jgi:hypothetical protein
MGLEKTAVSLPPPAQQSRGPVIRVRRYGWNDFERFDEETARGSHLCVGSASIGKVDIDCKYHWKRAQWGVLGSEKRPAGIVYMDITFKQPTGYWLDRASVFVTLSEDTSSYALVGPHRRSFPFPKPWLQSDYAVQITEHYGPRLLTGTKTLRSEAKANHFVPTISAGGFEVAGMGHQSYTSKQRVGRWVFKGTVGKPRGGDGFRTLEWELSENELDPDQTHNQEYHTAFAFEHSLRPVFMRVEVEGKIRSKARQLKHDLLKFSSQFGVTDNSTLTHLNFKKNVFFNKDLDHAAKGLDMAMQMENCERLPVEVPDPAPAQFTQDMRTGIQAGVTNQHRPAILTGTTGEDHPIRLSGIQSTDHRHPSNPSHRTNVTDHGGQDFGQHRLPGRPRVGEGQVEGQEKVVELEETLGDGKDNALLRSLRRVQTRPGSDLSANIRMEETRQNLGSQSQPSDDTGMMTTTAVNDETKTHTHVPETVDDDISELLIRMPVLLFFLRYIATMMKWLARPADNAWIPAPSSLRDKDIRNSRRLLEEHASRRVDRIWERPASPGSESEPALTRVQYEARRWGNG